MRDQNYDQNKVIVTGFAQVPKGTTLYEHYKTIGTVWVVNMKTGRIEDCEFTFVAKLTNHFVSSLVKGYNMGDGIQPLLVRIKQHCYLPSQGAIIQAIRSVWDRYHETRHSIEELEKEDANLNQANRI